MESGRHPARRAGRNGSSTWNDVPNYKRHESEGLGSGHEAAETIGPIESPRATRIKVFVQRFLGAAFLMMGGFWIAEIGFSFFFNVIGSMSAPIIILAGLSMVFGRVK